MKTKYLYDVLKRIRPWHAVSLVAAVTLSAIIVTSAMKLEPTAANGTAVDQAISIPPPLNNPGDSATGPSSIVRTRL